MTEFARQNDTEFLSFNMEETVGTAKSLAESPSKWFSLPVTAIALADSRGTGRVARAGIRDGRPGSSGTDRGSMGTTIAFTAPLLDCAPARLPELVKLLCACGFESDASAGGYVLKSSTKPLTNFPASPTPLSTDLSPATLTAAYVKRDNGVKDSVMRRSGCTGSVTITANAGEPVSLNFAMVGTIPDGDPVKTIGTDYSALCVFSDEAKGARGMMRDVTVTNVRTGTDYGMVNFSTFTLTPGHTTPDAVDPTREYGFGESPVVIGESTFTFTVAETRTNEELFLADWRNGELVQFEIVVTLPTCTYTIAIPAAQQNALPTVADAGGYRTISYSGICTRPLDSDNAPFTLTITDTTP
jgi:hypothetical protein